VLHFLTECFDVHHLILTVSSDNFPERSQLIGFVMKTDSFYWAEGIHSLNIIRTVLCLKFDGSTDFDPSLVTRQRFSSVLFSEQSTSNSCPS